MSYTPNIEKIKHSIFDNNLAFEPFLDLVEIGFFSIDLSAKKVWFDQHVSMIFSIDYSTHLLINDWLENLEENQKNSILETIAIIQENEKDLSLKITHDSVPFLMYFKPIKLGEKIKLINGFITSSNSEDKLSILTNMTHEIRTPVNAIKGYSELLQETELNSEQKNYLLNIQNTSKHLSKIVNDILDYSKLESGKMQIEKNPFKIDKLLDEVHSMLKEQTKQKQLYLDVMNVDCPKTVIGDAYRIRQILVNFVSNAAKFTEIGGISLTCNIDHAISDHQLMVNFKVKDTGIGINPKDQIRVFKAFDQANASTTRLYGGTGLGLNISMKIAHLMKGDIRLESKTNEGSTFILSVPLEYNPVTQNTELNSDKNPRSGSKILLVEDNPLNQKLSERILSNLGMKVTIASNGLHATNLEKEKHFDMIFMDIHMPIMDGYEATRIIRKHNPKILIIAMSSDALYDEKNELDALGFNDSIEKPVDPQSLLRMLIKWIPE
ncbi:MAG: response regulator [Acholeplasmataceae bacterium]|nr:response regulator [Acholeplasmataceae bacterium]